MIGTKNKSAFSLMEVIVAVSLFAIIILSSTEIFRLVINSQREAIASQNVQESLKYFFEVTGKEMRMARRDDGTCPLVTDGEIFTVTPSALGDVLHFQNFYKECVSYQLATSDNTTRWQITRGINSGFISPIKINIESLDFEVNNTGQPVVTMTLSAHAIGEQKEASQMKIQTSITSRYYRN